MPPDERGFALPDREVRSWDVDRQVWEKAHAKTRRRKEVWEGLNLAEGAGDLGMGCVDQVRVFGGSL
jgi:hypothetical protein